MIKINRLKKGQELISGITEYLQENEIKSGFVLALGAVSQAELMMYKLSSKEYFSRVFKGDFELVGFQATITLDEKDKEIMIHPHAIITNDRFEAFGGHLKEATVAATVEFAVIKSDQELKRYFDSKIGLNLIDISK